MINTKEDTSLNILEEILISENEIDVLYKKLMECNKEIINHKGNISRDLLNVFLLSLPFTLPDFLINVLAHPSTHLESILSSERYPTIITWISVTWAILTNSLNDGTLITDKIITKETLKLKKELLEEIRTKQKDLNRLKNNINYNKIEKTENNSEVKETSYSYKFQTKLVSNDQEEVIEYKTRKLKNG